MQPLPLRQCIYILDDISVLCLDNIAIIMDSKRQSNIVLDGEARKDDITSFSLEDGAKGPVSGGGEQELQKPVTDTPELEIWNKPSINMWRYFATLYTFVIMGMNDAAYGVSPCSSSNHLMIAKNCAGIDSIRKHFSLSAPSPYC